MRKQDTLDLRGSIGGGPALPAPLLHAVAQPDRSENFSLATDTSLGENGSPMKRKALIATDLTDHQVMLVGIEAGAVSQRIAVAQAARDKA